MKLDELPWIDIGRGVEACEFRYEPDGQLHIAYRHDCRMEDGRPYHAFAAVPVSASGEGRDWKLISLNPIWIEPSLLCLTCQHHGFIRNGRWVPA